MILSTVYFDVMIHSNAIREIKDSHHPMISFTFLIGQIGELSGWIPRKIENPLGRPVRCGSKAVAHHMGYDCSDHNSFDNDK